MQNNFLTALNFLIWSVKADAILGEGMYCESNNLFSFQHGFQLWRLECAQNFDKEKIKKGKLKIRFPTVLISNFLGFKERKIMRI